jgi:hypothetical protein
VILLICFKLDYIASLPDIIRIGENFSYEEQQQKIVFAPSKMKILFHATQGDVKANKRELSGKSALA